MGAFTQASTSEADGLLRGMASLVRLDPLPGRSFFAFDPVGWLARGITDSSFGRAGYYKTSGETVTIEWSSGFVWTGLSVHGSGDTLRGTAGSGTDYGTSQGAGVTLTRVSCPSGSAPGRMVDVDVLVASAHTLAPIARLNQGMIGVEEGGGQFNYGEMAFEGRMVRDSGPVGFLVKGPGYDSAVVRWPIRWCGTDTTLFGLILLQPTGTTRMVAGGPDRRLKLRVQVSDSASGIPIGNGRVNAVVNVANHTGTTDNAGWAALSVLMPADAEAVFVRAAAPDHGHATALVRAPVSPVDTVSVALRLGARPQSEYRGMDGLDAPDRRRGTAGC